MINQELNFNGGKIGLLQQLTPDEINNLWLENMKSGAFEEAWRISDFVFKNHAGKDDSNVLVEYRNYWNGTSLQGKKVLIHCNHGLGDTIQFIRYAVRLRQIASTVIVAAQPALMDLLRSVKGIDTIISNKEPVVVQFDSEIEIMELPHIFRTTPETIPANIPYIFVDDQAAEHKVKPRVGLVWKASEFDKRRNINFDLFSRFQNVHNIEFYIMQGEAEKEGWDNQFGVYPGPLALSEYANVLKSLDLLISIDSMPVHLAGAMGVQVWTLLHSEADWRWMNRDESLWYPGMRLFRQPDPGNWEHVLVTVYNELKLYLNEWEKP